jgi:hypothetical protein
MPRKKWLILPVLSLVLFIFLTPYALISENQPVPFSYMQVNYSLRVNFQEPLLAYPAVTFVLATDNIVNSTYIEVDESIDGQTVRFYVSLSNKTTLLSRELLPELPPHGEYYDLWIGAGYKAGDVISILNSTVTLSSSGLKFHGGLFFDSLTTEKIPFNFSRTVLIEGTNIHADYAGEITITYDRETGLMIEDHQSWTANLTYPTLPRISYTVDLAYQSSNVSFTYTTYLLTIAIYTTIVIIIVSVLSVTIYKLIKRKPKEELRELPPETPTTPSTPPTPSEPPAENPQTPKPRTNLTQKNQVADNFTLNTQTQNKS